MKLIYKFYLNFKLGYLLTLQIVNDDFYYLVYYYFLIL